MITASQCRAGRALIEWTEDQLAEAARVSVRTIADFEHERTVPPMTSLQAIEAALLGAGVALVDGGKAAGSAWSRTYTAERYHQPADELTADWRFDGIAADAELLYALGRRLADSDLWPEWKEGSEFKAVREETKAERR